MSIFSLGLLLAFAFQAASEPPDPRILRVRVAVQVDDGYQITVDRAFVEEGRRIYTFRRNTPAYGRSRQVEYTDSIRCPQARAPLEAVENLALPLIDLPGVGREMSSLTLHAPVYELEASVLYPDGQGGSIVLHGGTNSSIESWYHSLAEALESCWSTEPSETRP